MKIKILFDMDGTLTSEESLALVARRLGVSEEFARLTREACTGCVDYDRNLRRRIGMLSRFTVEEIRTQIEDVPFRPILEKFIRENRQHCAVVSSNLDCWGWDLVSKLGCDSFFSNAVVDEGRVEGIAAILDKGEVVDFYRRRGFRVVYVGDGDNDFEAMEKADYSIAVGFGSAFCQRLAEVASMIADSEYQLVEQLNEILDAHEI